MTKENIIKFINKETEKATKHNIKIKLKKTKTIKIGNESCNGLFLDTPTPTLITAIKKPISQWLPIFTHESSHMDQFIEKSNLWDTDEAHYVLGNWLNGQFFRESKIKKSIHQIILVEADCEKRTIEKIKENNLPISITEYAQGANAYLLFHQWMIENRKWYTEAPYEIKEITKEMPTEIMQKEFYLEKPEKSILQLFNKYL